MDVDITKIKDGKDFIKFLQNSYKYVYLVTLAKKEKIKSLKEKFNRMIIVSNEIDIKREKWTTFRFKDGTIYRHFFINFKLIHPIEKLPVFELKEIE